MRHLRTIVGVAALSAACSPESVEGPIPMADDSPEAFFDVSTSPQACVGITPSFFVNPNTYPVVDPTLDEDWQTATANTFTELDLDGLTDRSDVDYLLAGSTTIDIGLLGAPGTAGTALGFFGNFPSGGGVYGTVSGGALLNVYGGVSNDFARGRMTFAFSEPVFGFGAWVFDDAGSTQQSFRMIARQVDGTAAVSPVLESGNGNAHFVEGFLGATSAIGIEAVEVEMLDELGRDRIVFEVDHLQVSPLLCTGTDQVNALIDAVGELLLVGKLDEGNANALTATLESALQSIAKDKPNAVNLLNAFGNKVEGFVNGGILASSDGQALISAALAVAEQL